MGLDGGGQPAPLFIDGNRRYDWQFALPDGARVAVSRLEGAETTVPPWAVVGLGRQDELLAHADLVICGGGHGMVAKTLLAGVPAIVKPGSSTGYLTELAVRIMIDALTTARVVAEPTPWAPPRLW